jgi:Fic/DOC family
MIVAFESELTMHVVARVAHLHLEFEHIHPFNDGNGRIGRVLMNHALQRHGFPPVIVRNKGKEKYYAMLRQYDLTGKATLFEAHLASMILESLHRRVTYLRGAQIDTVSEVARGAGIKPNVMLNQSRRQVIPAFRERGVWKIAADFAGRLAELHGGTWAIEQTCGGNTRDSSDITVGSDPSDGVVVFVAHPNGLPLQSS